MAAKAAPITATASQAPQAPQAVATGAALQDTAHEDLTAEVTRIRAVLEAGASSPREVALAGLARLKGLGLLPTKVLAATKIGIVLKDLSRASSADPEVRAAAGRFVEDWRQAHRKRKATGTVQEASVAPPKRCAADAVPAEPSDPAGNHGQQELLLLQPDHTSNQVGSQRLTVEQRSRVRDKILEELGKEEELDASIDGLEAEMRDPVILSTEIEEALYQALTGDKDDLGPYLKQSRALLYNLKDPKNPDFRFKLSVGFFQAADVPTMTPESMASDAKNAERAKIRKDAAEEMQTDLPLRNGQIRSSGAFIACGKCQGTKTTHFQMKTRCSDEPMTTYFTCLGCGNRWKIC